MIRYRNAFGFALCALTLAAAGWAVRQGKAAPQTDDAALTRGKEIYDARCKACHRSDGKGTLEEMDLTDNVWKNGNKPEDIEKVIREGVKGTGMRPITGDYTDADIKALVKYVLKFSADAPAPLAEPTKPPEAP
jgi:cbb3-type cytochrome c oxidase subunit III